MKNKIILSVLIAIFALTILINPASARDEHECVTSSVTDISPSSIEIGEEFTIGIQIENCGSEIPNFVSFELLHPSEDIEIKEPLVINISQLYYGNSERFITYHMRTDDDASPGTYVIKTRLSYGADGFSIIKEDEITFEVIGEESELGIASIKTDPVLPMEGETVELTLRIENAGKGTAKSVSVYADHPFQGLKQSFIGALESEEDGPAILTFIVDKPGEFEFPVTISYSDDFGDNEIKTDVNISVLEKPSNISGTIFAIVLIALIVGGIFYFFKVKKSKDKIIKQLMKGNNNSADKKK
jgi:hypothetical protein